MSRKQDRGENGTRWTRWFAGMFAAGVALVVAVFLGILLVGGNASRDWKRSEVEQVLGSAKGQVRVGFMKTSKAPKTLTKGLDTGGCELSGGERITGYCRMLDAVFPLGERKVFLLAQRRDDETLWCAHVFDLQGGGGGYYWFHCDNREAAAARARDEIEKERRSGP